MTAAKTGRHEAPAQPQKPGFWQIYGVTVAVTLVVIGALLGYLWQTLEGYEAGTQKAALEELSGLFTSGDYTELALRAGIADNPYEDSGARQQYLQEVLAGGQVSYYKVPGESTGQSPVYLAKAGENPIGVVKLVKKAGGRFGRWHPESIEVRLPAWGNVVVRLPADALLKVNGREVQETDLYAIDVPYNELANLPDSAARPLQKEYRITGLFRRPELQVSTTAGTELEVALDETPEAAGGAEAGDDAADFAAVGSAADTANHLAKAVLPQPENGEKLQEMALEDARTYSLYLTSDYPFGTLAKRMIKGSVIYKNMQIMETAFYTNHADVRFSDEKTGNLRSFSPDIFAVDVDYTYTVVRSNNKQYPFPTRLTFYYLRDNGGWKIGDILIR